MYAHADYLLTIAIPTFNRAEYLNRCLSHIWKQMRREETRVEILVSDNCSTDKTTDIIHRYVSGGYPIHYTRNNENIGSDNNCMQCFEMAKGKYVLILGDDDLLLNNAVEKILRILEQDDYGIVHLNSYGFVHDVTSEKPPGNLTGYVVYDNINRFAKMARYLLTFISVNIVNKTLVGLPEMKRFSGTNLVHLGWIFPALLNSKKNVYVKDYLVAAKLYNSGEYRLCEVFGVNFSKISDLYVREGANPQPFEIIQKEFASTFFPANIIRARKNLLGTLKEDYYGTLYPLYYRYPAFWCLMVPAMVLPISLAYPLFLTFSKIRRFMSRFAR